MLIRCPECGLTRQVNEQKIPAGSEFATCPQCEQRFRFRTLEAAPPAEDAAAREQRRPPQPEETQKPAAVAPKTPAASPPDVWSAVEHLGESWEKEQTEERRRRPGDLPDETRQAYGGFEEDEVDEERRRAAMDAYRRQGAYGEKPSLLANSGSVPWEYQGGFMTPQGFLRTVALSFTRIPEFFGGIPARGSLGPALVFALLLRCLQFVMVFLFIRVRVQDADGLVTEKNLAELANVSIPELAVTVLFIIILAQFASAALVNLMIRLVGGENGGKADFRLAFKVLAYSMTPLVFVLVPQIGFLIAEVGSLVFFVLGLRHAFKLSWARVAVVLSVPFLIILLMNMQLASLL
ncbi:MAG: zinc-ribbon domain-containing protein [Deltaproteobacteria bacterium]|jgi:hypothetical protein|nr:zinc-ribbon domain-containing protein [Deltaproteobacteria bacterium]